ncbi:TonB-dependent receptor [Cryomorpha ignava]|uniref:TonB-dependent receptor n=1 Tax=Cryomorpha ignava TaxID=101383 RepID=A0A7K3WQ47_9FLAO|nr:TonB-dependent receptor [Cryomorpha ignava]NEN22885.1 TonB-dependent receptor [Cryomorpha ignava]
MKGILLAITLCLSALSGIFAQPGTIRGFVYEEESGEAVIFTNVYLAGTSLGASTDVNGYFSITNIPEGAYTLEVKYLGYETLQKQVDISGDRIITEKLFLKKSSIQMQAVEISAEKQEKQTNVTMSVTKATPKDIKMIPTIGGTADLAQYLQVVPGVIFTGDQGGQLYIRGGSPVQNKVLLDGMTIYNPFHSIGLFSVFDTELIRNADIYTGGFGAEYGGRISSVMDITMRDGNKRRFSGKVGASTFGANVLLEGPIKRQTNEGKSSSSFVFSAKHSYLDQSSKLLYDYVDEDGLPFSFTDLYGKVSFNASTGSKFSLFGFNYTDATTFQETSSLDWNSTGGGLNFVLVPEGSPVLVEGQFNISDYKITLLEQNTASNANDANATPTFLRPRTSGINSFNFGINFKYFSGDNEFKYGVDITGFGTDLSFYTGLGELIQQEKNSTELAGFATYKFKVNNLILDLGFRAQYYSSLRVFKPEPRIGVKYNITKDFRLKAAGGLYSQNLISTTSDRDIVSLFYGFLVAPEDIQNEFLKEDGTVRDVNNPLQTAYHVIAGAEYDLTDRISVNLEGYYKNFNQITNINRNKIYSKNDPTAPDILKNDFIIESGEARGVDFTFKYEDKKYYLWAVYSLADVDRWDGVKSYNPIFDRRHNINLLASRRFGKRLDWEVNFRWNYGSGFPFTQNQGFYLRETLQDDINTDITESNSNNVEIQYAGLNQGKLPDYSRLDFTVKKTFEFSEYSKIEASISVTNVYNRENIFYVDRVTSERINQLPILPSFGFLYSF